MNTKMNRISLVLALILGVAGCAHSQPRPVVARADETVTVYDPPMRLVYSDECPLYYPYVKFDSEGKKYCQIRPPDPVWYDVDQLAQP